MFKVDAAVVKLLIDTLPYRLNELFTGGKRLIRLHTAKNLHTVVMSVMTRRPAEPVRVLLLAEMRQAVKVRRLKSKPERCPQRHSQIVPYPLNV